MISDDLNKVVKPSWTAVGLGVRTEWFPTSDKVDESAYATDKERGWFRMGQYGAEVRRVVVYYINRKDLLSLADTPEKAKAVVAELVDYVENGKSIESLSPILQALVSDNKKLRSQRFKPNASSANSTWMRFLSTLTKAAQVKLSDTEHPCADVAQRVMDNKANALPGLVMRLKTEDIALRDGRSYRVLLVDRILCSIDDLYTDTVAAADAQPIDGIPADILVNIAKAVDGKPDSMFIASAMGAPGVVGNNAAVQFVADSSAVQKMINAGYLKAENGVLKATV